MTACFIGCSSTTPTLPSRFLPDGQLGLGRLDFSCSGCGDETVGSAGLGVRFSPARQLAIGAQLDAYAWDEGPFELAVTTAQLVLQYLF